MDVEDHDARGVRGDDEPDGNFVIRDMAAATVWSTGTGGHPGAYLSINEAGAMSIYDANDVRVWSADRAVVDTARLGALL